MTLQKETYAVPSLGKQGQESRQEPLAQGSPYIVEDNTLEAGAFAFQGSAENLVKGISEEATDQPLGVCVYTQYQIGYNTGTIINPTETVKVDYRGCVFSKPFENDADYGAEVWVDPKTGSIKASNDGAEITDYVNTGWKVKTSATAGNVVEIERI